MMNNLINKISPIAQGGEYVSNNDATAEKDGTKTRTCTVCGGVDFNTLQEFMEIITKKGGRVCYTNKIKTVSSYVAAYEPFPNIETALPKVDEQLKKQKHTESARYNRTLAIIRRLVIPRFVNQLPTKDKGFNVSKECISCGMCEKICIARNIELVDGKPSLS